MAAAPTSLGDIFAKKGKKKIKGENLNNATTDKAEVKKLEKKDADEEGWGEEEQVVAATLKVEAAGKLLREDEGKKAEDATDGKPAWGSKNDKAKGGSQAINEKKYPTLSSSVRLMNSNIDIDDGTDGQINIATSKNAFGALGNSDDEDASGPRRPKEIKPALVRKTKGEFATAAVQREVEKYVPSKKGEATSEANDGDAVDKGTTRAAKPKKAKEAKAEGEEELAPAEKSEEGEDTQIQLDAMASKAKYEGRRKSPLTELPVEEMRERRQEVQSQSARKKMQYKDDESDGNKLAFWDAAKAA